ncbi:sigma-70 family RNA polymerase sigma factor [Tessaracoccus massiliensis]|uniref:sigma-70 family RNA polymerase sigma factor n=1 Tax=Tessaracoccus massiliensis TaxID=1522311 RepID=UPI0009E4A1CA|nr:sigma-70 family RNA polymerase sigma factor [Tessaracoccus massiliensis]
MMIPDLELPHVTIGPGEDAELARAVEAGLYAAHLIDEGSQDTRLAQVVERGRWAAERFAWVGIRMAIKYARRASYLSGLPEDDLFQDGCVAVAEAIRRFDHTRSFRFTTFVHEYLVREMADGARHRIGHPSVSRADRRSARQVLRELESHGVEPSESAVDAVVRRTGLSPTATQRGRIKLVALDVELMAEGSGYEHTAETSVDFLALLLPRHRQVLQLRFGLKGPARTLAQIAEIMHASPSTVSRWQQEALEAARNLLAGERTTTAAAYRDARVVAG